MYSCAKPSWRISINAANNVRLSQTLSLFSSVVVVGGGGGAAGGGVGAVAMVKTQQGKQIDKHALTLLRGNGQSNTDTFH